MIGEIRYVVTFKFPSGQKYAATTVDKKFALSPIVNGLYRHVLTWDSEDLAKGFIKDLAKVAGGEKYRYLCSLDMKIERILMPHNEN